MTLEQYFEKYPKDRSNGNQIDMGKKVNCIHWSTITDILAYARVHPEVDEFRQHEEDLRNTFFKKQHEKHI